MNIKAVIFDMDGTLVDTEAMQHRSWNTAIKHFGTDEDSLSGEEYAKYAGKDGLPIAAMIIKLRPHINASPQKLKDKKQELMLESIKGNVKPIKDADTILKRCKELGLKVAIATGASREAAEINALETKIEEYYDFMVTATEVENRKPHPQSFIDAYTGLGVEPEFCVAVEDTDSGVNSAVSAGLYTIAKPSGAVDGQDLSRANVIVSSLLEVMDHIEKLMKEPKS